MKNKTALKYAKVFFSFIVVVQPVSTALGAIVPPQAAQGSSAPPSAAAAPVKYEVRNLPLDFTTRNVQLRPGLIAYGWRLMTWQEWLNRPSSGPLLVETTYNKNDIEVFEARSAVIVNRPVSFFNEKSLHNINTVRKLSPSARHQQVVAQRFTVESTFPFPQSWSEIIRFGKRTSLLDDKTSDYLQMTSVFGYADKAAIDTSPKLAKIVKLLDIAGQTPEAINFQGTLKVNQIANAISVVTLFYRVDDKRTLVVNHMAITLKRHILNLGVNSAGLKLNGRGVLLGENAAINSDKGIGAGLPNFARDFFEDMARGLDN